MKKTITLIAILAASVYGKAQSWINMGNGMGSNYGIVQAIGEYNANNNIVVGGYFSTSQGSITNYIAQWNGTAWSSMAGGMNGQVLAFTNYQGKLIAGGNFTSAGGTAVNNIAAWNGTSWADIGGGLNGTVSVVFGLYGALYAGGTFSMAGSTAVSNIAKWDGTSWSAMSTGMNGAVYAIDTLGTVIYVGGNFTTAGGVTVNGITKWSGAAWEALTSGVNGRVNNLSLYNSGNLCVSGYFTTAGGNADTNIALWNGTTWTNIGLGKAVDPEYNAGLTSLTVYNGNIYAGTEWSNTDIWKWNGTSWSGFGELDSLYCLYTSTSNYMYAGGGFALASGHLANEVAVWCTDSCLPLSVNNIAAPAKQQATVFPNPSNGIFNISITNYELKIKNYIEVYNLLGEKVYSDVIRNSQFVIDLSSKSEGMYLYRIINENGAEVSVGKLIIK